MLVVFAGRLNLPSVMIIDSTLRTELRGHGPVRREIYSEYLDESRLPDREFQAEQAAWLQHKYRDKHIDVGIAVSRRALDVLLDTERAIRGDLPIVFGLLDNTATWQRPAGPVTGLLVRYDVAGTIQDGLSLFPETKQILVVSDATPVEDELLRDARAVLSAYEEHMRVHYVAGGGRQRLRSVVSSLPDNALVLVLNAQSDWPGNELATRELLGAIATASPVPVITVGSSFIGTGIVGGRHLDYQRWARTLAELTERVLRGEDPAAIPVIRSATHQPAFDAGALARFAVPTDRLPSNSVLHVLETGATAWSNYRWQLILGVSLLLIQSVLIGGLLVQRRKRARAEQMLAERLHFETVLADTSRTFTDVLPELVSDELERWLARIGGASNATRVSVTILDEAAGVLDALYTWSAQANDRRPALAISDSEISSIRRGAVVSRPLLKADTVATLVLVPLAAGGRTWGALALETPIATPFGEGVPIARLHLLGEVLANALARNRAAEELAARTTALTESHEEYRRLADRLIEAQESERRRIARELHDDITQRLTLIGIEAGEIGRRDGNAALVPGSALERLAEEVRTLVRDVTGLSHRLHPSLLERLGAAAAIRVLCREMAAPTGIKVTFSERNIPDKLPATHSLAMYRVAQEALRNAIKHSGAREVAVVLTTEGGVLILEVTDDGSGFDVERTRNGSGLGLLSMSERVQVLDGMLTVYSEPDAGTSLRVFLPLLTAAPGDADEEEPGLPAPVAS